MDVIYQGVTWRRQVTIIDETSAPVDPVQLVAVLCPETPMTVTGPGDPGVYLVELTAEQTGALTAPHQTRWELLAQIGSDVVRLIDADVVIQPMCARLVVTP